jgi:hypothetical protein
VGVETDGVVRERERNYTPTRARKEFLIDGDFHPMWDEALKF